MKKMTIDELADFFFSNMGKDEIRVEFWDNARKKPHGHYIAAVLVVGNAPVIIIDRYEGSSLFSYDMTFCNSAIPIEMALRAYCKSYAIEAVYMDEKQFCDNYHGWVSVEERLPDLYESVELPSGVAGHWDGEIWRLDTGAPIVGVTKWRKP